MLLNGYVQNANGERHLFIDDNCQNVIESFGGLTWNSNSRDYDKSKGLDHFMDGIRYATWQILKKSSVAVTKIRNSKSISSNSPLVVLK